MKVKNKTLCYVVFAVPLCLAGTIPEPESKCPWGNTHRTVACERNMKVPFASNLYLFCPENYVIKVVDALWGRMNKDVCPSPYEHIEK